MSEQGEVYALIQVMCDELRGIREGMNEIRTWISTNGPIQAARARTVTMEHAQAMLNCGRSRIFDLLKSGALRRGPKVGKVAMICAKSLEALLERVDREPATPQFKRSRARHDSRRGERERDAILKLIRRD